MAIKHAKTSAIPDGPDSAQVQPSDWNADHTLPVSAERLLGNSTGASAEVAELSLGSGLVFGAGSLELQLKTINGQSVLGDGDLVIEGGGAGLTLFEESRSVASPNDTVPVHALTAIGAESNIDFVIAPKGTGALMLQVPDNTTAGGNKRGAQAIDLQTGRTNATNVASGSKAVAIGYSCLASGAGSVAIGNFSTATGSGAFAAVNGTATGSQSVALGIGATSSGAKSAAVSPDSQAKLSGSVALCGANRASSAARSQIVLLRVFARTTDPTPTVAVSDQGIPGSSNQLVVDNNSSNSVRVRAMAMNTAAAGGCKTWEGRAVVQRGANAASISLVMSSLTSDYTHASMAECDLVLSASTAHGALVATVTGIAGMTIRWAIFFENLEMTP